eukprot:3190485-Lingulodinium_polyedra.AAC.1
MARVSPPGDTLAKQLLTPDVVTWPYRAPEISMALGYSAAVDIWSLGIIMRELLTGTRIWELPQCRGDSVLASAMRVGGIIDPTTWLGCEQGAWAPPPPDFPDHSELIDAWERPVPRHLTTA